MNTLSLSVSNPSRSKGSSLRSSVKTALSRPCCRTSNGPHSVHPVAMPVKTSVCTKLPLAEGPLCATRSASTKPGGGSCQSAKVRTGTLRRTAEDGAVRRRVPPPACARTESPVHRRRAHRQQTRADLGSEPEMSVPLHRLNENGRQRFQPLAADPVRCLPEHDQRFADRLVIKAPLRPWGRAPVGLPTAEHAHGVLAMETSYRDELVQDAPFLGPPALAVSLDDRRHKFIPRRHAHPPHDGPSDPIRAGSISDEATAQHSGTFLARRCGRHPDCRAASACDPVRGRRHAVCAVDRL